MFFLFLSLLSLPHNLTLNCSAAQPQQRFRLLRKSHKLLWWIATLMMSSPLILSEFLCRGGSSWQWHVALRTRSIIKWIFWIVCPTAHYATRHKGIRVTSSKNCILIFEVMRWTSAYRKTVAGTQKQNFNLVAQKSWQIWSYLGRFQLERMSACLKSINNSSAPYRFKIDDDSLRPYAFSANFFTTLTSNTVSN